MNVPLAVDDFQTYHQLADPSPICAGAVDIGRQESADALRGVRGKCLESELLLKEKLNHLAQARSGAGPNSGRC